MTSDLLPLGFTTVELVPIHFQPVLIEHVELTKLLAYAPACATVFPLYSPSINLCTHDANQR